MVNMLYGSFAPSSLTWWQRGVTVVSDEADLKSAESSQCGILLCGW